MVGPARSLACTMLEPDGVAELMQDDPIGAVADRNVVEARLIDIEPGVAAALDDAGIITDAAGRRVQLGIGEQAGHGEAAVRSCPRSGARIDERRDRHQLGADRPVDGGGERRGRGGERGEIESGRAGDHPGGKICRVIIVCRVGEIVGQVQTVPPEKAEKSINGLNARRDVRDSASHRPVLQSLPSVLFRRRPWTLFGVTGWS
jgi:hypothetical protein